MDRNIGIVRQLEQVFEPYYTMFVGLKGWGGVGWGWGEKQLPSQYFCRKKKTLIFFLRRGHLLAEF
jgi:hypothetical protein